MDNPFERYDLDPRAGLAAITARLKELAEDAKDDDERELIRAAWEELTLHPSRRLRAALFAHPETRAPLGTPPAPVRRRVTPSAADADTFGGVDLVAKPSLAAELGLRGAARGTRPPSLDDDPLL